VLDKLNIRLRDESLALAEDRQRLQDLQAKARQKRELEQKIANLKRANAELRSELSERDGHLPNGVPAHVAIGEADKGLDFDGRLGQVEQLFPDGEEDVDPNGVLSPDQRAFLSSMERAEVLRGRTTAYQQHNAQLESQADQLRSRSRELEERYRKIVSLCTGEEVDKVDEKLDSLLQAVMSDQKDEVELGKVRDFLRLVRDTE
jgi:regulatory protein SWI6